MVEKIQSKKKNPSGSSLNSSILASEWDSEIKNSRGVEPEEELQSGRDVDDAAWIIFNMSLQHDACVENKMNDPFVDFPRKKRSISQKQLQSQQDMDDAASFLFNVSLQHGHSSMEKKTNESFIDFPRPRNLNCEMKLKITFSGCECGGNPILKKRRISNKVDVNMKPEMPQKEKDVILEMGGCEARFVIQKHLQASDTNQQQARLQIPKKQVENDFLREEEEGVLEQGKGGIPVLLIQPSHAISTHCLKKRRIGKDGVYQITNKWNSVVDNKANGLTTGAIIQLWSFRTQANLCFAILTL